MRDSYAIRKFIKKAVFKENVNHYYATDKEPAYALIT